MSYSDPTIAIPATGSRLLARAGNRTAEISAQPAVLHGSRTVLIRIAEGGKKAVYEIPLEEWSRLHRDATRIP